MPEENKRFFFLQLPHDFFRSRRIKKMRRLQDGDTLIIIYLKLQLLSLNTGGMIQFSDMDGDLASEISAEIDEEESLVSAALDYLTSHNLANKPSENSVFLPYVKIMTSSHTASTERSRKSRKNKKMLQERCNATEMQQECNADATQEKKIRREEDKKSIDKTIDVPDPSYPTLPETDCTISDEMVCGARDVKRKDVQRVIDAWNATGLKPIERITPESKRGAMTRKRILEYGMEKVLEALTQAKNSKFLHGKNEKGWEATYDWFILPSNFQKVLEGNYAELNSPEDDKKRKAKPLSAEEWDKVINSI